MTHIISHVPGHYEAAPGAKTLPAQAGMPESLSTAVRTVTQAAAENGGSVPWQEVADRIASNGFSPGVEFNAASFEQPIDNVQIVDQVLSDLVLGTPQVADMPGAIILPPYEVDRWNFRYLEYGVERLVEYDAKRGFRAEIKHSDFKVTSASDNLVRYSWQVLRDYDELSNDTDGLATAEMAAMMAREIVELSMEIDRAELLTTATNYPASHRVAIGGGSEWDSGSGDTKANVQTARDALCDDLSVRPEEITVALSNESYRAALTDSAFITWKENQWSGRGGEYPNETSANEAALASYWEVGKVWVFNVRKADNTGTMTSVYGDVAIVYYDGTRSAQAWDRRMGEYMLGRSFSWNRGVASMPYNIPNRTTRAFPWHAYMQAKLMNSTCGALITNTVA